MQKLEELIAALENATGPNYALEVEIFKYVHPEYADYVQGRGGLVHTNDGCDQRVLSDVRPGNYTASIDAAFSLANRMLPDWRIENLCEWDAEILRDQGPWMCDLVQRRLEFFDRQSAKCSHAPTAALALLIATLRAKLHQEKNNAE
ncbi:hypothetical protein [Rhizobium rhizogenes]|uniref:hypothetical protein n=1 Tax=Rhizobium rhizogenes TaxID=359 RepID=UPI001572E91A|nr:hypothetical protein [Rhizobium rhizogenes]NTG94215.1 hypothetical protein [Rhizobium rhizogenes]